jgi:polar amino acid transport system substrate-binding protein
MLKKAINSVLVMLLLISLIGGCAKNNAPKMATVDDVADKRIGVYVGTIYDKFAVKRFPGATIFRYNSISDFVLALKNKRIDTAITNLYSAKNVIKVNPDIGILTDDLLSFPIGIGFNKNNPALREKFNAFLKKIKADGSFDTMYQKWFNQDLESIKMSKFEGRRTGAKIVLGVAVGDLPNSGYVNGEYVGFDLELLQTFAQNQNLNLKIVTMEFGGLIAALAAGKVDMIADCIAITEERKAQVAFSDPYMEDKSALIALKANLANASSDEAPKVTMADIARKKVGVLQGSVHDSFMAKNYPDAQVSQYKNYPDLILAAKSGKVDAGFLTSQALKEYQKEDPSLKLLLDNVFAVDIGMGFNKENEQLRTEFNAFLKEIKANGVYDDLIKRWYQDGSTEMPTIANPKKNGKLIVGIVSDKGLPYAIVKDNRLIGSDVELVERFAAYLGKELVFKDMEFGNLIAAVLTNKIDMITSTLMITEERKKQIAFSDPYYKLSACVFTAKKASGSTGSFWQGITASFYNNIILENRYLLILDGLKTTAIISLFAICFGTLLGALICFLRMSKRKALALIAKLYIALLRGLPVLVLLMLIFYVVFAKVNLDPVLVAVIAFGMNFAAYVAEMFRSAIDSIDKGQTEAGIAGGFTKTQTFLYIVMPQAIRQVLPVYKGELISLVKSTSIVGYIAVQDLTKASDIIRSRTFDAFFPLIMTAVLYFAISGLLLALLNNVERKTDPKRKRNAAPQNRLAMLVMLMVAILVLVGAGIPVITRTFHKSAANNGPLLKLSQLDGKRICVITGTTGDFAVRERFKKAKILDMNYPADAALAVKTKKADAFAFDKCTLQYLVARSNGEFALLPDKLAVAEVAIPMQVNDKALHQKINAAIKKLKADGTLNQMYQKWFVDVKNETPPMPSISLKGQNGTLQMGTCLLEEPFAFVSNGEKVGFDIELGYRLAEILGVKLEIIDMSYDAIIAGLRSGKIDLAIANFYKFEERQKTMEFSDTYLKNDISVLVRRAK